MTSTCAAPKCDHPVTGRSKTCSTNCRKALSRANKVVAPVVAVPVKPVKVTARGAALAANERTYVGKRCPRCGEKVKWTNWGSCATCETWEQAHDRVYPPVEMVSTWSKPPDPRWTL